MNLRTRLSRSNGYRELGMYDESILELEEIEGEDRWHPLVVEARHKTYRGTKEWRLAMTMARVDAIQIKSKIVMAGTIPDNIR